MAMNADNISVPSPPHESQLALPESSSLKQRASDFDLAHMFLEAEAQTLLDFMLQENGSPPMQPQPRSAEEQDGGISGHHGGAETKKRTRNESIVVAERLRRIKMRRLFSTLRSLLPVPTSQASRLCLIEEARKYIQSLQTRVQELQTTRDQLLTQKELMKSSGEPDHLIPRSVTDPGSCCADVVVDVYGTEVIVQITSFRRPRHLWRIYQELEFNGLDVLRSDIYAGGFVFLHIHAKCLGMTVQRRCSLQTNLHSIY